MAARRFRNVAVLDKECQRLDQVGLTLAEAKAMLRGLQKVVVERQAAAFVGARSRCMDCGAGLRAKGGHTVIFRTLLGSVSLDSPRLRHCRCGAREARTFSPLADLLTEHTSPELVFMETKWASLVSYGMTVKALRDFLPVDEKLNAATVRNHTLQVAERCDAEMGEEQVSLCSEIVDTPSFSYQ